ncbi:non-ribosomal peptide synthetase [Actinokineospora globicatena]|uniref:non-ribosomal peptide synthetase n=1 Tax=Actinokineospora globicatena TaxID=103729 RepID=UPI0025573226|nr:amino acid adenylation domain-containing protein [Actinokineospora globicatena]
MTGPSRPVPLSPAQRRLWFQQAAFPDRVPTTALVRRVSGPLDVPALRRAVTEVVRRHEVLRTRYTAPDGVPHQVVGAARDVDLAVVEAGDESAARKVISEVSRDLDLATGAVLRAVVVRLGADDHVVAVVGHHIALDGWSLGVLEREISALYGGRGVPPVPLQYGDYALWQNARLDSHDLRAQAEYWTRQLADLPLVLDLPVDRVRPDTPIGTAAELPFHVPDDLRLRIARVGPASGASPFMVLLAGFHLVLGRFCGVDQLAVGSPVAGRRRPELEGLVGLFVNFLVLRGDLAGVRTFADLVARTRDTVLAALDNQDLPFERVVELLSPERDVRRHPVVQVAFQLLDLPDAPVPFPGLRTEPFADDALTAEFDLGCSLVPDPAGGLNGSIIYRADLFDRATIAELADGFVALLDAATADPEGVLPAVVEHPDWNDTAVDFPRHRTIPELFAEQASARPDAIALVCGQERLTYRELDQRSSAIAGHLRVLGAAPEVRVGLGLSRGIDAVVAMLAISRSGAAYVPLDPLYPAERLGLMVREAGIRIVVTAREVHERFPDDVRRMFVDDAHGAEPFTSSPHPDNLAVVFHTSGSTGTPKSVEISHRSVLRLVFCRRWPEHPVVGHVSSVSFDAATVEVWVPLLHGGTCVISPEPMPTAAGIAALTRDHRPDILMVTTALFNTVIDLDPTAIAGAGHVYYGGEAASAEHLARAFAAVPEAVISNCYGPTEVTTWSTLARVSATIRPDTARVSIGRPIGNTVAYVLDGALRPARVGELYLAGPGVARGYGRSGLTAQQFLPNPFGAGDRIYRTGDRVRRRPDGTLEFLGRGDDQVKVRGHRVEPAEVELALSRQPGVRAAAVLVDNGRLIAFVAPETLSIEDIRAGVALSLPDYLVPSAIVALDALPLTPGGKLDRSALRQLPVTPATTYLAPRDEVESDLCALWQDILGLDQVGTNDDFFTIGGHSLLAAQLAARITQRFGVDLPVVELFTRRTITALATLIRATSLDTLLTEIENLPDAEVQRRLAILTREDTPS